jgi:hypothetical protein
MAGEIESALARFGDSAFSRESLRPVVCGLLLDGRIEDPPFYERHGQKRVDEGVYAHVIRFREHVAPFGVALGELVRGRVGDCGS